jgi:phage shock protein PspC (stress-responsive transcriptional regulator)
MQNAKPIAHEAEEYIAEPDKLFGICLAIGEALGFNPFYLRVALIALTVFNPVASISTYAGLGVLVLLAHIVFPKPDSASTHEAVSPASETAPEPQLPLAA